MDYKLEETSGIFERHCLQCGDPIGYGRSDKKFCSNSCRQSFWNKRNQDTRAYHTRILGAVEKNYSILAHLLSIGVTSIDLTEIMLLGFKPELFTGLRHDIRKRQTEYYNYEIRYQMSKNKVYGIRRMNVTLSAI